MRSVCLLIVGFLVAGTALADETPVTVKAAVDKSEATIGDRLRYEIIVEYPAGLEVTLPSFGSTLGEFAIEDFGSAPPKRRGDRMISKQWYRLDAYVAGEYTIPEPVATFRDAEGVEHEAKGPALKVMFKSLLPSDWELQDIRPPDPPVVAGHRQWWLWVVGAVALIGAGIGVWWWRRRHAGGVIGPPPKPSHEVALAALEALRREDLLSHQRYETYYIRLSGIVRQYVEGRFGLRAPEMTTEEFLQAATGAAELTFDQRQLLRQFLAHCDLVKFARYRPSSREAEEAYAAAHRFVQETKPVVVSAPAAVSRMEDEL